MPQVFKLGSYWVYLKLGLDNYSSKKMQADKFFY